MPTSSWKETVASTSIFTEDALIDGPWATRTPSVRTLLPRDARVSRLLFRPSCIAVWVLLISLTCMRPVYVAFIAVMTGRCVSKKMTAFWCRRSRTLCAWL
ncbi:hypothetical protein D3C71_1788280 [compost metagenome]